MIETVRAWLLGVIAAAMCLAALEAVMPKGIVARIGKVTGALVLLLVLLRPAMTGHLELLEVDYEVYRQALDREIRDYRQEYQQQMEELIEAETGAYISEKAAQMGLTCRVEVEAGPQDEGFVPTAVTLSGERDEVLSAWIAQEIGIDAAQQYWEEGP